MVTIVIRLIDYLGPLGLLWLQLAPQGVLDEVSSQQLQFRLQFHFDYLDKSKVLKLKFVWACYHDLELVPSGHKTSFRNLWIVFKLSDLGKTNIICLQNNCNQCQTRSEMPPKDIYKMPYFRCVRKTSFIV